MCIVFRIGECRAYWSLGNAHMSLGDYKQARTFSAKHLRLAEEMGDVAAMNTAQHNLSDLDNMVHLQDK